jgi:hypothetical protein
MVRPEFVHAVGSEFPWKPSVAELSAPGVYSTPIRSNPVRNRNLKALRNRIMYVFPR